MATAGFIGRLSKLYVNSEQSSVGSADAMVELLTASLNVSMDTVEMTSNDSAGWKEFISGFSEGDLSGTAIFTNEGDLGAMKHMLNSIENQTPLWVKFDLVDSGGSIRSWTAEGYVTSFNPSFSTQDRVEYSFSIKLTGDLSHT